MRILHLVFWAVLLCFLPSCARYAAHQPASASRAEILTCRLTANNEFVEVRYRLPETAETGPDSPDAYLLDEATGEKFFVMKLQRVGPLPERAGSEGKETRTLIFRNRESRLKTGSLVTLIVGPHRQEHIPLEK